MQINHVFRYLSALLVAASVLAGGCASTGGEKREQSASQPERQEQVVSRPPDPMGPGLHVTTNATPEHDVWDRIRAGYGLPEINSPYIAEYERWYARRPEYVARLVERAAPYLYYIANEVEARGMPMEIALLPAIESAFKPHALSRSSAAGIWQFMPATGRHYGLKQNWWYDGRKDIIAATNSALDYLEKLNRDFKGDWALTLAAYNAGEGTVGRAIRKNARKGKPVNYTALKSLRRETRRYVPKLIAFSNIIARPESYGLKIASIPDRPYFSVVRLNGQIDLNIVAEASGVPIAELQRLNPGFKRWATDPSGPHRLLVPSDDAARVADTIAGIPENKRMRWDYYTVRKGDSLNRIARRHRVTTAELRRANKIRGNLIHPGQHLLIPISTAASSRPLDTAHANRDGSRRDSSKKPLVISVRKGDTLWSLSRRYNVSLNQLARWNRIDVNDMLHMGQKLKIWR